MTDYRRMYMVLCRAADSVIEPLEKIPEASTEAAALRAALLAAEEIYIDTAGPEEEQTENQPRRKD